MTYQFWWKQGAKRVVTARELSLNEIKGIRAHIPDDMEIETFIHGAMCISYSGRMSAQQLYGRTRCKPRSVYTSMPLEVFCCGRIQTGRVYARIYENERGTYIFNSKDLCMIEHIPELLKPALTL